MIFAQEFKKERMYPCGLRESCGSPICDGDYLCEECQAYKDGFVKAQKETAEKIKKLKKYFNCSPLECEKIDKIFGDKILEVEK